MSIYLVRHGQDQDNAAGILNGHRNQDLTALGIEQAHATGKKLKNKDIDTILSSPLLRTLHTAQIISEELGKTEVITRDDLIERDFGALTGKPVADIPDLATKILQTDRVVYFLEAEGAETFPDLLERAKKVLQEVQEQYKDKNVVLVTHGDMGKMIRTAYNDWDFETGLKTPYFDNSEILELS